MDVNEEEVQNALEETKYPHYSHGRYACIDNVDDFEYEVKLLREIYRRKPFTALEWKTIWWDK